MLNIVGTCSPVWALTVHGGCSGWSRRNYGSHTAYNSCMSLAASGVSVSAELRLANGSTRCEGRVEVTHEGTWASLCDEGWGLAEARAVCRQLGCGRALSAPDGSHFGQGHGKRWPNSVSCVGTETTLSACKVKPRGNSTCHHGTAAGVVCAGNPLASDMAQELVGLGASPLQAALDNVPSSWALPSRGVWEAG